MCDSALIGCGSAQHSNRALLRHRIWATLHGYALYVFAIGTLVLAAAMISDFLAFARVSGLAVSQNPFQVPLTITLHLAAIFLALSVTVSMSREREQGTLLVLFFGPLTPRRYLLSWLAAQAITYLIFCVMLTVGLVGVAMVSGIEFPAGLCIFAALSTPAAAATIAFGILVGSLGHDTRGSILVFLGVTLLLVGLEALNAYFVSLKPEQMAAALLPVSQTVAAINDLVAWLSPYSYLTRELNAIYAGHWPELAFVFVGALIYAITLLVLANLSFERRGVQP